MIKGQVSLDYMVLTALVLVLVGALFVYASGLAQDAIALNKTRASVKSLAQTINEAYALGPGTKLYAEINLPPNIQYGVVSDSELGYRISLSSGINDVHEFVEPELIGTLPEDEGAQRVLIEVLVSGRVRIGSAAITDFDAPTIYLLGPASGTLDTDGAVQFDYNVSDANSGIYSCELLLDGALDQTDYSVQEDVNQSFNKTFTVDGNFLWDVNCLDDSANSNEASSVNGPWQINTLLPEDTTPPVVYLESPAAGATDSDGVVEFDYNVNDVRSGVAFCQLVVDGVVDQNEMSVIEGVTQTFNKTFTYNGTYSWDVNCVDDSNNTNAAFSVNGPRSLTIAKPETTITRWALQGNKADITGAPDNVYWSGNPPLYGYDFNVEGLSGIITEVIILMSHEIPDALFDDTVPLSYGLTAYNDLVFKTYSSVNTPVDKMDSNVSLIEDYNVTSARPGGGDWNWSDFSNLMVGGDYVKVSSAESEWRLDAVGVRITYYS